ncbi:MAG: hypothetical protein JWP81_2660 [Ferruginibacter sp.]|nr:hypothetical protein [Ferruginibacter sp.]
MWQQVKQDIEDIWMHSMRRGQFSAAWQHCDEVLKSRAGKPCWHLPRHLQYIWNGEPLNEKRVLVRCYHGLGDTIQFIRYVALIKAVASEVIVWAQPKLIPLLKTVEGIDKILPLHDGVPEIAFDVDVEVMELAHIFRSELETIPIKIPYLHIDSKPHSLQTGRPAVGLVWKSGEWNQHRSVPFSLLSPLASIPGLDFYILQHDAPDAGWDGEFGVYPGQLPVHELAHYIAGLDLLISIDSMPVHLAGALGVPVWTLLQAEADWRWMDKLEYSPWYPTMRLFRQQYRDEWEPVIGRIAGELRQLYGINL